MDGPVPAPFLAPAMPKAAAPAAAPLPAAALDENTPLSFLIKGITNLANGAVGRKLSEQPQQHQEEQQAGPRQAPAPGVTISLALQGETKESFAPKKVILPPQICWSLRALPGQLPSFQAGSSCPQAQLACVSKQYHFKGDVHTRNEMTAWNHLQCAHLQLLRGQCP